MQALIRLLRQGREGVSALSFDRWRVAFAAYRPVAI